MDGKKMWMADGLCILTAAIWGCIAWTGEAAPLSLQLFQEVFSCPFSIPEKP